jgi:hypothetical protein
MSMLKFFYNRSEDSRDIQPPDGSDPLADPALAIMSQRELADLPLMPEHLGRNIDEPKPRFAERR